MVRAKYVFLENMCALSVSLHKNVIESEQIFANFVYMADIYFWLHLK